MICEPVGSPSHSTCREAFKSTLHNQASGRQPCTRVTEVGGDGTTARMASIERIQQAPAAAALLRARHSRVVAMLELAMSRLMKLQSQTLFTCHD